MMTIPAGFPADSAGAFGVLRTRVKLGPDDLKVLAMIEAAGEAFYFQVADGVQDPQAKELLKQNGREERGHAYRLAKILRLQTGEEFTVPDAKENPYLAAGPATLPDITPEFIASLEHGEADGDRLYQVWAESETDPEIARLLRLNGKEESRHGERDAEVIRRLKGESAPA
jgi:hypothetical protein